MPASFNDAALKDLMRRGAMRGVVRATEAVRNEAIRLMLDSEHTGHIYGRRRHQASAPGEPPAPDTGRLIGSITTTYDQKNLTGKVVVGAQYGLYLEFGTQRMEPRPFLRPALANMQGEITRVITEEIQRGLQPG
jgi:HK97 gp10 family phage protein